jgi:endonuclease I
VLLAEEATDMWEAERDGRIEVVEGVGNPFVLIR